MPFREKQKLPYSRSVPVRLSRSEVDDSGNVTSKFVDASIDLPPRETMRLGNLIKAGVPIQEVNGKLLGTDSVDLNLASPKSKSESKPEPKSESKSDSKSESKSEDVT